MKHLSTGERIKRYRVFKGFKHEHLAKEIKISRQRLSKIENDQTGMPVTLALTIANALGLQLEELVAN